MPPRADLLVSVVAPVRNQATILPGFLESLVPLLRQHYEHFEVVLIDDGSTDNTQTILPSLLDRYPNVRALRLSRAFGADIAITSGLDSAIGDVVVTLRPETDPPGLIPSLVEQCRSGKDVLFGVRSSPPPESALKKAAAAAFFWIAKNILQVPILPHATYYQVFSRQALNAIVRIKDKARYLRLLSTDIGYQNRTFRYDALPPRQGTEERTWAELAGLSIGLLTANSANPLRAVSLMGLLASCLNLLYVGYIVLVYLFKPHVAEGWATLSLQTAGLFFWVLLILTVLSEYVGRILGEIKDRPLYFTLEEMNSRSPSADAERRNIVTSSK